jgi:hypothetical protein
MKEIIPVVLFAYARPDLLRRTLACLRENQISLLYTFSDGPKTHEVAERVSEVRLILREIDWCEVHLVERTENLGLGKSIMTGVTEVFHKYEAIIVFEDDLICVPGTYLYLCAALNNYRDNPNVMSVTGWTHERVIPKDIGGQPYFDGRAECLVWGAWRRSWDGMDRTSLQLISECRKQGLDIYRYGYDLFQMAKMEKKRNLWAVRFSYLHILKKSLCLRPPQGLVQHIGHGSDATNTSDDGQWGITHLCNSPVIPEIWPEAVENLECPILWQKACGKRPTWFSRGRQLLREFYWVWREKAKRIASNNAKSGRGSE